MTSRRPFQFSAPGNKLMPEMSPKRKPNPEPLTSGDSDLKVQQEALHPNQLNEAFTYQSMNKLREGLKSKPNKLELNKSN
jgi:hypothetical protein